MLQSNLNVLIPFCGSLTHMFNKNVALPFMSQGFLAVLNASDMASLEKKKFHINFS